MLPTLSGTFTTSAECTDPTQGHVTHTVTFNADRSVTLHDHTPDELDAALFLHSLNDNAPLPGCFYAHPKVAPVHPDAAIAGLVRTASDWAKTIPSRWNDSYARLLIRTLTPVDTYLPWETAGLTPKVFDKSHTDGPALEAFKPYVKAGLGDMPASDLVHAVRSNQLHRLCALDKAGVPKGLLGAWAGHTCTPQQARILSIYNVNSVSSGWLVNFQHTTWARLVKYVRLGGDPSGITEWFANQNPPVSLTLAPIGDPFIAREVQNLYRRRRTNNANLTLELVADCYLELVNEKSPTTPEDILRRAEKVAPPTG